MEGKTRRTRGVDSYRPESMPSVARGREMSDYSEKSVLLPAMVKNLQGALRHKEFASAEEHIWKMLMALLAIGAAIESKADEVIGEILGD